MSVTDQEQEVNWEVTSGFASSNISEFWFDRDTDTLRVFFNSGQTYDYYNVAPSTNRAFQAAPSKGQFFDRVIKKGGYPYEEV